jgi:hypothetical protein
MGNMDLNKLKEKNLMVSSLNNQDNGGKQQSPGEKLWKLMDSDFFIPLGNEFMVGEKAIDKAMGFTKLLGRKNEVNKIFNALFSKRSSGDVFNPEETVKAVALMGPGGIGKALTDIIII